jgi:DivIVA domain-containing protein
MAVRGGFPMSTDLDLPVLMNAEHIRRREFVAVRRGYDPTQVREFLEHVADQIDQMEALLSDSRMEADAAMRSATHPTTDPYAQLAGRVASVLQAADEAAVRLRRDAASDAERILSEARDDAERIRSEAQTQALETRAAADSALHAAREQADRTIAGLSTKREVLVEQLAAMQERLVGVARELESTIGRGEVLPAADEPEDREDSVWAIPRPDPDTTSTKEAGSEDAAAEGVSVSDAEPSTSPQETPDADAASDGDVTSGDPLEAAARSETADAEAGTIVIGEAEASPGGSEGEPADHLEDDAPAPRLDRTYDELWEGTDPLRLDVPDIPSLDLDWDDLEDPETDRPEGDR